MHPDVVPKHGQGSPKLVTHLRDMLVVGVQGIHVDDADAAKLLVHLLHCLGQYLVELVDVLVPRNLAVDGDVKAPGTIVVDDQVVDADDLRVAQADLLDFLDKLRVGGRPQQLQEGRLHGVDSSLYDDEGHDEFEPSVQVHRVREPLEEDESHEYGRSGKGVRKGVHSSGVECGGVDFPGCVKHEVPHVALEGDGGKKGRRRPPGED